MGPVLPPRVMGSISSHHYSAPMNFRKGLTTRCTSGCIAVIATATVVVLIILLALLSSKYTYV